MQLIILLLNTERIKNYVASYNTCFPVISTSTKALKFLKAERQTRARVPMNHSGNGFMQALTMRLTKRVS